MKQSITFCQFCDGFRDMDRNDNFSYAGKRALFDYLEEFEEDTGEELEFDVIALCCDFSEESSALAVRDEYTGCCDRDSELTEEEEEEIALEWLRDNTMVIEFDGGIIYQAF